MPEKESDQNVNPDAEKPDKNTDIKTTDVTETKSEKNVMPVVPTTPVVAKNTANGSNKKPLKQWQVFSVGVVAALLLVLVGVGGTLVVQYAVNGGATITGHTTLKNDGNKLTTEAETTISSVASKVSPSVVSIVTQIESPVNYFYSQDEQAAGTGFIVGSNGIILTNKHVVAGAKSVQVIMADGKTYKNVKVLGTDPLNDLAFLQIANVKNMPTVELGDSSTLNIGQSVVAIGNSLGQYQNTVTSGIVSGLGRPLTAQSESGDSTENLNGLIQTDAAINPGNSGGPLLNMSGQVIGINTAIAEDAQSIGFAIPINSAKGILKGVLAGKSVQRAYLGLRYVPINVAVQSEFKLSVAQGAYVHGSDDNAAVISGGPASKAGIKDGDIITKVNGVAVTSVNDVANLVAEYAPGDTIQLTILRGHDTKTFDVTLGVYTSGTSDNS